MKKVFFILLALVLALSVGLVACTGEQEEEEEEEEEPEVIQLTFSDHNPPGNPVAEGLIAYGQYIEDNYEGVEIDVQIGGALYSDVELFTAVQGGAVDAGTYVMEIGDGIYYGLVITLPFMGYPSQLDTIDIFWELYDEFPEIQRDFTDRGVRFSSCWMMAPVQLHFHAANMEVTHPDELVGLEICALEGTVVDWIDMLGATGIQFAFPDLATALTPPYATDGYMQHMNFLWGLGFIEEFQSHVMFGEGGLFMNSMGVLWNKERYDSLPADLQEIVDEAKDVFVETAFPLGDADLENALAFAEDEGHTMTWITAEQLEAWREKLLPYHQDWIDNAPDPAVAEEIYNRALELAAEY